MVAACCSWAEGTMEHGARFCVPWGGSWARWLRERGLSCPALVERSRAHSSALTSKVVAAYTEPSSLGNPRWPEPWQQLFAAVPRLSLPFWPDRFGRDARSLAPGARVCAVGM